MSGPKVIDKIVEKIKALPEVETAYIEEDHCDGNFWINIKVTKKIYDEYEEYYKDKEAKQWE